ncbi:MAG: RNA methyltransferase [Sandaracinaceae bacterium]|nr:RNA methyltransferase [Sandaracinaceae bacterium]
MAAHEKIYGRNAALAVLRTRMDDVARIAHGPRDRKELGPLLREAAARRIPYAELEDAQLSSLAESMHHEGLVVIARPRPVPDAHELFDRMTHAERFALVALDGVSNPHNVGAILRSAAFLGLDAVVMRGERGRTPLTPAAVRIAEGAAEQLPVVPVPDLDVFLAALGREGYRVLAADARGDEDAMTMRWPTRGVLVLGSEASGISDEVRRSIARAVSIRGTGAVESLNVSVAAGVLFAAWTASERRG